MDGLAGSDFDGERQAVAIGAVEIGGGVFRVAGDITELTAPASLLHDSQCAVSDLCTSPGPSAPEQLARFKIGAFLPRLVGRAVLNRNVNPGSTGAVANAPWHRCRC